MRVARWIWENEFSFKYPPQEELNNVLDSVSPHVRMGMFQIFEWIAVTKGADLIDEGSLRRVVSINNKVFQICIVRSKNKQAFFGFSFDTKDAIFYLMGLWPKEQVTEGDFLALAEMELSRGHPKS